MNRSISVCNIINSIEESRVERVGARPQRFTRKWITFEKERPSHRQEEGVICYDRGHVDAAAVAVN